MLSKSWVVRQLPSRSKIGWFWAVGQCSSHDHVNSVNIKIELFHLEWKLRFPCAKLMLWQMHWTSLSVSEFCGSELTLYLSFWAVAAESNLRWLQGRKKICGVKSNVTKWAQAKVQLFENETVEFDMLLKSRVVGQLTSGSEIGWFWAERPGLQPIVFFFYIACMDLEGSPGCFYKKVEETFKQNDTCICVLSGFGLLVWGMPDMCVPCK